MLGRIFGFSLLIFCWLNCGIAFAQDEEVHDLNIQARSLDRALLDFGQQTSTPLLFSYEVVENLTSNEVVGSYTASQAIELILEGTGLRGTILEGGGLSIGPIPRQNEGTTDVTNSIQSASDDTRQRRPRRGFVASVAAIAAALGSPAVAQDEPVSTTQDQDADERTLDKIVVKGIRGSLRVRLKIKSCHYSALRCVL